MQHPNPNFQNRSLYQMDNLAVLRGINSGTIDLIATDPPFNKGRDFHATPASLAAGASFQDRWSWKDDVQTEWVDAIEDGWPETHALIEAVRLTDEPMAAYLCFMGVRLMEMQRVLKDTGSIYLHCDPTANAYLRLLMDTIFGAENFRNEIAWCYRSTSQAKRWFPRKHDNVLFYSKTDDWLFNHDAPELREAYLLERLPKRVNNPVLRHSRESGNLLGPGSYAKVSSGRVQPRSGARGLPPCPRSGKPLVTQSDTRPLRRPLAHPYDGAMTNPNHRAAATETNEEARQSTAQNRSFRAHPPLKTAH